MACDPYLDVVSNAANCEASLGLESRAETEARGYCLVPRWRPQEVDLLLGICDERPLQELCPTYKELGQFLGDVRMLAYRGCVEPTEAGPGFTFHGLLTAERFIAHRRAS